jgi:DNA mismatch repair protein MutL
VTRGEHEMAGTFVSVKDGAIQQRAKRGSPPGTAVTVRGLFRSVPARLKFLKSTATENGHISQLITQYGLAFPEVRFSLTVDGRTVFRTTGSGSLREVLGTVFGAENSRAMLQVGTDDEGDDPLAPAVAGFVSPPSLNRATRGYLSFFVNRRWVQSRMLAYALEQAYEGLLMTGRHPLAVINIQLPPRDVDVNVHPSKIEVKFRSEREIFGAVHEAVRATLIAHAPVPTIEMTQRHQPSAALFVERLFAPEDTAAPDQPQLTDEAAPETEPATSSLPILRLMGQVANTYIVAEGPDGMYIIDQHAAHERVLYEKIREQRQRSSVEVQGMLQPVPVELTVRQQELLESNADVLSAYGFGLEHFGERTYLVRSVPSLLAGGNAAQAVTEILDSLGEEVRTDREDRVAVSLACHSAALAGKSLSHGEMQELIGQLEEASQPRTCPHGRPTMIHLSAAQLEKGFGRR